MTDTLIRAHHGMCLHYYIGKGYSDGFNANMTYYKKFLENEDPIVEILVGTDEICAKCPNNLGEICVSAGKVRDYDEGVLKYTGVQAGDKMHWSEFCRLVEEKILQAGNRENICGECQWTELCK